MLELSPGSVSIRPRMNLWPSIISWLKRNRTSARMAFVWRMIAMVLGSVFSLIWFRLLLHTMGDSLMGLFQSFQGLTRLGGLGDLGISGALSLKAGLMLGRKDDAGLKELLASARSLFLLVACGLCLLFIALSPWLPSWMGFKTVEGAGSMTWLFVYGGLSLMLMIVGGYFASLNYAHGTVSWPIFPTVLFSQILAPFFHWRLAALHMPLWVQMLPYLGSGIVTTVLAWFMLKWSHPSLGDLTPLKRNRAQWSALAQTSWWAYLISIGYMIYLTTDRLVIGAVIGQDKVTRYMANNRVCELLITVIVTASFVGLPKLTHWISSHNPADRERLLTETKRLSMFEIVAVCGAVLGYLAFNNLFIRLWLDKAHVVPLPLQIAFACNLAVTIGGNTGIQLSTRAGDKGLKYAGLAIAGTGLLNLVLSILSAKLASIYGLDFALTGVAVATAIAQSVSSIVLGTVTCRYLGLSVGLWISRCWLLPVGFTLFAALLKELLPDNSFAHLGLLSACYLGIFIVVCRIAGLDSQMIRSELNHARALFSRGK
jgi:O-antigen/teichoic acid export membrane protein